MSNIPAIPEFTNTLDEMATTLRAIKLAVEQLAGRNQTESLGAPQVFVKATEPDRGKAGAYNIGDIWINTSTDKFYFWGGAGWRAST